MSVCETCEDTHQMTLGDRTVMCTRCPLPCRTCANANGTGPYCATPRCKCGCHDTVGLAKAHLSGGPSPPFHESTTGDFARDLLDRADQVRDMRAELFERSAKVGEANARIRELEAERDELAAEIRAPIPMRLVCEGCGKLHIDEGEFATKVHHTHSCQFCGLTWRPAVAPTVGVRFLPGFKSDKPAE